MNSIADSSASRSVSLDLSTTHVRPDTQTMRVTIYLIMAFVDVALICISFIFADIYRNGDVDSSIIRRFLVGLVPLFLFMSFYLRLYSFRTMMSVSNAISRVVFVMFATLSLDLAIIFLGKDGDNVSRIVFFVGASLALAFMCAVRLPAVWVVRNVLKHRFIRRVLVVDDCPTTRPEGFELIDAQRSGLRPDVLNPIMLHNFSTMVAGADRVVVSCPAEKREQWSMYLRGTGCSGELLMPELHAISPVHSEKDTGWIGIRVSTGPLDLRNRVLKRAFDLAVTVPAILLLAPFLITVAIAIKLDSSGSVLFRQRRMGRGNRLFDVYKFRSMKTAESDADGKQSTSRDDRRVTRVGRLIRSTSIDELPQLFNVFLGEMSLVGPRPHALGSTAGDQLFWNIDQRYWLRHAIKPGITGLAQVRGYRGATEHQQDLTDRLQSDLEYVANWSLMNDIAILIRTAAVVVHKKAY